MADQLVPVPLITPGFKGLNKAQAASTQLDPGWAIELQNAVFDDSGRTTARKGWAKLTTAAFSGAPAIEQIHEYIKNDGTTFVVCAANNKLLTGTTTLTDVTGAVTPSANSWQFINYNNFVLGWQTGHTPIKWNGAGNFAVIAPASGTLPTGNCALAAFGRVWATDSDNQTIKYCGLLDETNWGGVGAGSINMATVWTRGTDEVMGLAAAGANLVVFGRKHIIIFTDSTGATVGINPTNIVVLDTVEGTGLVARDTIQSTGEGDLTFLAPTGVQSLGRLLINKNNPVQPIDPQVADYVKGYLASENIAKIRSVYSPTNRFYLILLPTSKRAFYYDVRQPLQDGSLRAAEWPSLTWSSVCNRRDGNVLLGELGIVGQYSGYTDNLATYRYVFSSPNLSLGPDYENRVKILKKLKAVCVYGGNTTVTYKWGKDFAGLVNSAQVTLSGTTAEYGIAEYGIAEYGGGAAAGFTQTNIGGSGRWVQFGAEAIINGYTFGIQQLDAYVKIGNMI